jgi:hypothetical protein
VLLVVLQAGGVPSITWVPGVDGRWAGTVATVAVIGVLVALTRRRIHEEGPERQTVDA